MLDEIEVVDYTFVEVNGDTGIKFDSGEFAGVIVSLNNVAVETAEESSDHAVLSFNYDVVWGNEILPELLETVEFKNEIGNILLKILKDSVDESEQANTKESSLQ